MDLLRMIFRSPLLLAWFGTIILLEVIAISLALR